MKELKRKKMLQEKHGKPSFSAETVISKPKNQDHPVNSTVCSAPYPVCLSASTALSSAGLDAGVVGLFMAGVGVNAIRLFPRYGHILISANLDGTVKLYDLYNERRCLRTFYGHTRGVRDIQFNYDGGQFLSASFDRYNCVQSQASCKPLTAPFACRTIKLWDTETGQCIQRFSNRKMVYCVKYHPKESYQNNFLAGCADNRVHQVHVAVSCSCCGQPLTHEAYYFSGTYGRATQYRNTTITWGPSMRLNSSMKADDSSPPLTTNP